ncbi:hypothetical protein HY967_01330 [Candidatus Jorgensenbacteria bacterium]|nr:hypothetical protein [Candidatus Jorgensenbacteria bacterium]
MKKFGIGTALVIIGALSIIILPIVFGPEKNFGFIAIGIVTIGFFIQVSALLGFWREQKRIETRFKNNL